LLPRTIEADDWVEIPRIQGRRHPYIDPGVSLETPRYVAFVADDFLEAHDVLNDLLAELADVTADVAVWRGDVLAAIVQAGKATVFEPQPLDIPAKNGTRKRKEKPRVLGSTVPGLILWMGQEGWSYTEAQAVLVQLGVLWQGMHVGRFLNAGRKGKLPVPTLAAATTRRLNELRPGVPIAG
jgi:hypothetical protein